MQELATRLPKRSFVRHRFESSAERVRALLEAVSEAERVDEDALPPAALIAHAVASLREQTPDVRLERVVVATRGLGHVEVPTRVAGVVVRCDEDRAHARLRVSQPVGPVLEVDAHGSRALGVLESAGDLPRDLEDFGLALGESGMRYARASVWPVEFTVALAAAGVEAEEQAGLARLLRLTVDLVAPAPLDERVHFAIDGVKPIAGDMARVVFRVTSGRSRLVARGDAIIVAALARSAAMTLRRAA